MSTASSAGVRTPILDGSRWVGTTMGRPHMTGDMEPHCWCKPIAVECHCPANHGTVYGHSVVDGYRSDDQPRMSAYSRTWPGLVAQKQ